jgi:hypothetical protein
MNSAKSYIGLTDESYIRKDRYGKDVSQIILTGD